MRRAWIFALLLGALGLAAACGEAAGGATPTAPPAAGQPQTATATPRAVVSSPTVAPTPATPMGPTPTVDVAVPFDFDVFVSPDDALASSTRAIERATDYARQELGAQRVRATRALGYVTKPDTEDMFGVPAGTAVWIVDLAGDRFRLLDCTAASPTPGTPVALCEGSSVQVTLRVADGAVLATWIFE